ncbi:Flagellar assembly protein FliH [Ferriphaselus amnicola]|uniref:Flagellar assembly protein FliH n=1 Tax=Ferriphaselus amnicola TaxID=1188319 RepID=A0A2Z6GEB1_9PROT|nr:flagellar assembly protein FliH [Ferriphaselus amnicola]BBE51525.1 Flagellar assembly protein FliH [Ferriphaselus amnicola]
MSNERLTAWQRWELPSFDVPKPVVEPDSVPVVLPTASELEDIHQQSRNEGYQAGHAEGYQAGHAEGLQRAAEDAEKLGNLMTTLEISLREADQALAQEVLDLALEVARQMLHQALTVQPELILGVIREAINTLPHFGQTAHLVLCPADAELVRTQMGDQLSHLGWKITEDTRIERGSCRVDTAQSQIDAGLDTRWRRIVSSLGSDSTWLET